MKKIIKYVLEQMQETSTLRGAIGALVVLVGWNVAPERLDAVATLAALVSQVLKMVLPDRWGGSNEDTVDGGAGK